MGPPRKSKKKKKRNKTERDSKKGCTRRTRVHGADFGPMDIYSAPATPNIILKGRVKWIHPVSAQTSVNLVLFCCVKQQGTRRDPTKI